MNGNDNLHGAVTYLAIMLMTIVFITLKLVGVITWSWLWVMAPLWIPFCIGLLLILFAMLIALFTQED